MLVLRMRGIFQVCHWDVLWWHDTHIKFHKDWCRRSRDIKVLPYEFKRLQCWYYWWKDIMK
jgi:hypothetical protein